MKVDPNEPINALPPDVAISECFAGLTKREHMAIEFTKAYASAENVVGNIPPKDIAAFGIELADELIKHLNTEQ